MKILAFGEILWDIYSNKKIIGGAPFNFAAHLAQHGEAVYMLSSLGDDSEGKEARSFLKKRGISTEYVSFLKDKETGKCLVSLDEKAVPTYNLLNNVAYDFINCDTVPNQFDVLYFGTLSLRNEHNRLSLKKLISNSDYKEIFVDVNIREPFFTNETVIFAVENASILKISLEELPIVSEILGINKFKGHEEFAQILAETYKKLKVVLITLGGNGAYALNIADKKGYSCKSQKVEPKSTVGAGDSFSAAFLHRYLRGCDMQFCIEYAAKVAAFVVSKYDAVPNYCINDFM